MIKAQELRIGNLVETDAIGIARVTGYSKDLIDPTEVIEIGYSYRNKEEFLGYKAKSYFNVGHVNPIPITEEWLLKFGFEKIENLDCLEFYKDDVSFFINLNGIYLKYVTARIHIKHIHQLQNLYFDLTGEELTIKNKSAFEKAIDENIKLNDSE